jgi:hypothetical protein
MVIAILIASAYWERKQTPFQNAPKLMSALQTFSRAQVAAGRPLPPEISLRDLLQGCYLTTNDVRALDGADWTFSTQCDEANPQAVLARTRTSDGQFICLLADGSVQEFSASRYMETLQHSGQPADSTNGIQPFHPERKTTPGAAGAPR